MQSRRIKNPWTITGDEKQTLQFYRLTPDKVLNDIERVFPVKCTGRVQALNSMENRVFEIELEMNSPEDPRSLIAKFYRPGRWNKQQIEEEHNFLAELDANDVPVVVPYVDDNNESIFVMEEVGLYFCAFPKQAGRSPDELSDQQLQQVGRLLARMHNIGEMHNAENRLFLTPEVYGEAGLEYLLLNNHIPPEFRSSYQQAVETLCNEIKPLFSGINYQRIHGDCHMGNLLAGKEGMFWVDFDDMVMGPCVQDLWLLMPGRDEYAQQKFKHLLDGYNVMRAFDQRELRLIEPLRALRYILFTTWIAKRWQDPAFPRAFPYFGTPKYWGEQVQDLREQIALIREQNDA